MNEYVVRWLASKGIRRSLGYGVVGTEIYYQHAAFIGVNEKYYRFNMVNTDDQILGSLNTEETLRIEAGAGQFTGQVRQYQQGLFDVLDHYLTEYETFEEFRDAAPKQDITAKDLDYLLQAYRTTVIEALSKVSHSVFHVQSVVQKDEKAYVNFIAHDRVEFPLKLRIGEPSVVSRRNYGKLTSHFEEFVEKLCDYTGDLIWR